MGLLTDSARTCIHGSGMHIVGNKVMENYSLVFNLGIDGRVD